VVIVKIHVQNMLAQSWKRINQTEQIYRYLKDFTGSAMQEPSRKPVKSKAENAASAGWLRHFTIQ